MSKLIVFAFLLGFVLFAISYHEASAVCCFPYDMIHYIDPETGNLVVNGELWNDSYRVLPFGNSKYEFLFHNSTGKIIFEKELVITKEHPIQDGFVIHPGTVPLPFQITIDDVNSDTLKQVSSVSTGRTSVQYFEWKPPDLEVHLEDFSKIATIKSKTQGDTFDKWQISGTITNTHSQMTQNVYVLASLYNADHHIVGVAGYSDDDIQPETLDGNDAKEFKIHALVPQSNPVQTVRLYAESDDSSAKYDKTKPIILRPAHVPIKHGVEETPITISANVTNITRDDMDFDWIIQIKKSPKSLADGDISKHPNSTVAFIKMIPASVSAQDSQVLEYPWVPESGGIYFYEMFLWEKYKPVSLWFRGSFLYSDQILVSTNSLKDQLSKSVPLDELECRDDLILAHKSSNSNFVCVKPESLPKLVERGWAISDNWIKISNANAAIHYEMNGAKITSVEAFSEYSNPSLPEEKKQTWLQFAIESKQTANLQITLPRNIIDSKMGNADDGFFVLLDGVETEYHETKTESERILNFTVPAKIDIVEIVGYGYYNPEFDKSNTNNQKN